MAEMKNEGHAQCGDYDAFMWSIETNVGTIYYVEHEDERHELKQDYIGVADKDKAVKAFRKAYKRICEIVAEELMKDA